MINSAWSIYRRTVFPDTWESFISKRSLLLAHSASIRQGGRTSSKGTRYKRRRNPIVSVSHLILFSRQCTARSGRSNVISVPTPPVVRISWESTCRVSTTKTGPRGPKRNTRKRRKISKLQPNCNSNRNNNTSHTIFNRCSTNSLSTS